MPQFAVAEQDGEYLSACGYILCSAARNPDVWVSVWVARKGHNGVGLELMNALPGLLHCGVLACNNIRANTCTFYQFWAGRPGASPTITGWAAGKNTVWRSAALCAAAGPA